MPTKFGFKNYFKPTPKRIRILGDSMAGASTLVASFTIMYGSENLGTAILITGWVGKFLSNFFTDEPTNNNVNNPNL
jgi:hypothetical protein